MKMFSSLLASVMCFCAISPAFAAGQPADCVVAPNEQDFFAQLSDDHKVAFCAMNEAQRTACMQMAQTMDNYGNQMTPDEAVASVSGESAVN